MTAISELFSKLYTNTMVLLTLLLIELILLIRQFKYDARLITPSQYLRLIEEKNPTIQFTKRLKPHNIECRVCLSEFEEGEKVRNLKCKHTFHKDCLDKWLQQYFATCPLCRNKVLPDNVVAKYRQLQNQTETEDENHDDQIMVLLSALRGDGPFSNYTPEGIIS